MAHPTALTPKRARSELAGFLASIRGIAVDCKDTDLASRVDEILYGPGNEHT